MEEALLTIMPEDQAGAFNQALMELGATVCVPNGAPLCTECPWREFCRTRQQERWNEIPVKSKAKPRKIEEKTVFVIRFGDQVVLNKRPTKGLLAGLYEFPNTPGHLTEPEALDWAKAHKIKPIRIQPLQPAKHIFSHVEWHMAGWEVNCKSFSPPKDCAWITPHQLAGDYALPSAFRPFTQWILKKSD